MNVDFAVLGSVFHIGKVIPIALFAVVQSCLYCFTVVQSYLWLWFAVIQPYLSPCFAVSLLGVTVIKVFMWVVVVLLGL